MSSDDDRHLTTTSYAMLGLLATRPWATYELTKQMRRSLHHVWPRAESNVYAEAKRLVAAGLVTTETRRTGKRARTIYTITPAGLAALRRWLGGASGPDRLESETMLKVLFANHGTKAELLANLRHYAAAAEAARAFWQELAAEYLRGERPFPERVHINALFFRWKWQQIETDARWARWAIAEVESWPDTTAPADPAATLAPFRAALEPAPGPG